MISFLGKLFGSEKVIDAGISGIDKAFYTDEEKADMRLRLLSAYEPFKLAQRLLALVFASMFAVAFLFALVMTSMGIDITPVLNAVEAFDLGWIVLAIVSFYFGGGAIEGVLRAKGGK